MKPIEISQIYSAAPGPTGSLYINSKSIFNTYSYHPQTLEEIQLEAAREELRLARACRKKEELLLKKAQDEDEARRRGRGGERTVEERIENLEGQLSRVEAKQDKILKGGI